MGRRPGSTTKSGRFMNPADQERKSMRQKELKRNRKQRTMVRQAILKSKDIDEILENLSRLDDQEFDIHVEHHSKYVFNEKRAKFKQTYNEVMNLYKQEKRDDKVKELEQKIARYEAERARKLQQFNALRFSLEANPLEIPLPDGSSVPNAAMTPATPTIPAQFLMPQARAGILKNSHAKARDMNERTEPPGPPCGLPPSLGYEDVEDGPSKRRVRFEVDVVQATSDKPVDAPDDDFGPVEIPPEVLQQAAGGETEKLNSKIVLAPAIAQQPLIRAPPLPPNMLPPPPQIPLRVPPPPPHFPPPGTNPLAYLQPPVGDSVISAEPVVRRMVQHSAGQTKEDGEVTISAEPKLRDLTKEVTKFVPTTLRIRRHKQQPKRNFSSRYNLMGMQVESAQRKEAKDTDEAYAEFMNEVSDLL